MATYRAANPAAGGATGKVVASAGEGGNPLSRLRKWRQEVTKRYDIDMQSEHKLLWMVRPILCMTLVVTFAGFMFYLAKGILSGMIELNTALSLCTPFVGLVSVALGFYFTSRGKEKVARIDGLVEMFIGKTS